MNTGTTACTLIGLIGAVLATRVLFAPPPPSPPAGASAMGSWQRLHSLAPFGHWGEQPFSLKCSINSRGNLQASPLPKLPVSTYQAVLLPLTSVYAFCPPFCVTPLAQSKSPGIWVEGQGQGRTVEDHKQREKTVKKQCDPSSLYALNPDVLGRGAIGSAIPSSCKKGCYEWVCGT